MKPAIALLSVWASLGLPAPAAEPAPLTRAHAHNDYEHSRPLLDALDQGFCSVEADVWLLDGELRVAHDQDAAKPGRTLQKLYLDPLLARIQTHRGRVFPEAPLFTLLVDVKSDATNTYRALLQSLRPYRTILTRFEPGRTVTNAVTIILSGNRARELMALDKIRWTAMDGRLGDLEANPSPHFIPLISDNWSPHFRWRGAQDGPFPEAERAKLRLLVQRAHDQGRRLRLWNTPDSPVAWKELADAGLDLLNTDDLPGLAAFFRAKPGKK